MTSLVVVVVDDDDDDDCFASAVTRGHGNTDGSIVKVRKVNSDEWTKACC